MPNEPTTRCERQNAPNALLTVGRHDSRYDNLISVAKTLMCGIARAPTVEDARSQANRTPYDVIAVDGACITDGAEEISMLRTTKYLPEVLILEEFPRAPRVENAVKTGAWDVLSTLSDTQQIHRTLECIFEYRTDHARLVSHRDRIEAPGIIGDNTLMADCMEKVAVASKGDVNVLIIGETGTGKELLANAVHCNSPRRDNPFVVVDCTSMPESLVESVLFGNQKGAYTGAVTNRDGLVKQADGGTLFIDEIGELPMAMQTKFLRVLQEKAFRPVGSKTICRSDFRVVTATNQNLEALVQQNKFREDLLFRLKSMIINPPPLRKRTEDIEALCRHQVGSLCKQYHCSDKAFASDFFSFLERYWWPGNIRELHHALERAVLSAGDSDVIYTQDLPDDIRAKIIACELTNSVNPQTHIPTEITNKYATSHAQRLYQGKIPSLKEYRQDAIDTVQAQYLETVLQRCQGDVQQAIRISGLSRSRFYALCKEAGIFASPPSHAQK